MEEKKIRDIATEVHMYWKETLRVASVVDTVLENSIWDCDYNLLDKIIRSFSPEELGKLYSDNEKIKFYYMQRTWFRYLDVKAGRSVFVDDTYIQLTGDSSVTELDITADSLRELRLAKAELLWQASDAIASDLSYEAGLDVASAIALLNTRRYLC